MMNQDFQLFKWIFFYESMDAYTASKTINEDTDGKAFIPLFAQLALTRNLGIKDDFENNDYYKENKRRLMLDDDNIDSRDFKFLMRNMMRDVLKHSLRINVPNADNIRNRIEIEFFR